jgi:hypothetical protein
MALGCKPPWGRRHTRHESARADEREVRVTPTGRPSRAAGPRSPPAMRPPRRVGRPHEKPQRRPPTRRTTRARRATPRLVTPDWRADPRVGSSAKRPSYPSGKLPQPRRPTRTQPCATYDAARQSHSPPEQLHNRTLAPDPSCGSDVRLCVLPPCATDCPENPNRVN